MDSQIQDVNGKLIKAGMKVYDLSVPKDMETYGPLDTILSINGNEIILSNGHRIIWKGPGYYAPVAVA